MSTRRPKVPKPAADGLPAAPRVRRDPGGQAASTGGNAPGTAAGNSAPGAPKSTTGAKTAGRKPRLPKSQKDSKPNSGSAARAAARQELAAEIRSGVSAPGSEPAQASPRTDAPLQPVPAKSFSGRLLALGIVMVVVTVLLAPSVRTYLQQRSEIAALEAQIAREQEVGAELEQTLDRWEDPAFIKAQARERIFLVMPGETRYLVKGENGIEEIEEQAAAEAPQDLEWVDALWDSVLRSATAP
ncbi:FtsB family cell division protein [Arthrobacter sp. 7Tela_A1]|uniref:FtsB family cell division protein n=1 Tax=Arthrobacter sp. 7Tela_A1 TaxID=3093745 RepID=UPI003BB5FF51